MHFSLLADALVLLHFCFILWVVFGGIIALKYPRLAWIHLPALCWGVLISMFGFYCPLTEWEIIFRHRADQQGYSGGFIQHYLLAIIYPSGLTRQHQIFMGVLLLAINMAVYWRLASKRRGRHND